MVRSFALSVENNGKSNFELDGQRCEAAGSLRLGKRVPLPNAISSA